MSVARSGDGLGPILRAYASQIHPVFMLPPLAASAFGSLLAADISPSIATLHAAAIFFAVYTAHIKDGYVDFHIRDEDDDHPLTEAGCRLALVGAATGAAICLLGLGVLSGPLAVGLTAPTWAIGYLHAPQLDTNPVTATIGYPVGIALALIGAFGAQTGTVSGQPLSVALVLVAMLAGVKIIDDAQDYDYDRSIGKHTVAVTVGMERAHQLAYALMAGAMFAVAGVVAGGILPLASVLAVVPFGLVVLYARRADPDVATMLLIRGAYVFLAVLVAAVWFRPLA